MANVLPQDAQKKVWAIYRARFVLVIGATLLLLAVAACITLIPSYVALEISTDATRTEDVAQEEGTAGPALARVQSLIEELKLPLSATTSPTDIVLDALSLKPAGIGVTRVLYTSGDEGKITFIGSGSREQVSEYRDRLVKSGRFTGVAVPVGALVGSEGGGFSILLTGQF